MKLIVHITGFYGSKGRPLPKEIGILSMNGNIIENWIVAPLYDFFEMDPDSMDLCLLRETLIGLKWNAPGMSAAESYKKLNYILQSASHIIVKDTEVMNFIKYYTRRNTAIILPYIDYPEAKQYCAHHGLQLFPRECSLNEVYKMKNWLEKTEYLTKENKKEATIDEYIEMKPILPIKKGKLLRSMSEHINKVSGGLMKRNVFEAFERPKINKKKNSLPGLKTLFTLLACILMTPVKGLIGYDCNLKQMNITTLSLLGVENCKVFNSNAETMNMKITLIQYSDYAKVKVQQCKVVINRQIRYCGMHSHTSAVENGDFQYIKEMGREECSMMHQTRQILIGQNTRIIELPINKTFSQTITFAGKMTSDGQCKGTFYADQFGSWADVVVFGWIKIELSDYYTDVNLETNTIHLRSGTSCQFTDETCTDKEEGPTYWSTLPESKCHEMRYDILYKGLAEKEEGQKGGQIEVVYTVVTSGYAFALLKRGQTEVCGYNLIKTEHPKLFIIENSMEMPFLEKPLLMTNIDIYNYMNSKFVYVERHVGKQMTSLYQHIMNQKCELESEVLRNQLTLAMTAPDQFAYLLMKKPGYMAVAAGEVVHIIRCMSVEVKYKETEDCYQHLPIVKLGNEKKLLFLTPRTRMILKHGIQISCDRIIPPVYNIEGDWYKIMGRAEETTEPRKLRPSDNQTWIYTNPRELASTGIYTKDDIAKFRDHMMFPLERPAILSTVARSIIGHQTNINGMSLMGLLDEDSLKKIANSTWSYVWGSFLSFGTASAGVLGAILILRGVKLLMDTIVHGYALHTIYGWSIHLLGAVWDSMTNLLVHLGSRRRENKEMNETGKDIEKGNETAPEEELKTPQRPPRRQKPMQEGKEQLHETITLDPHSPYLSCFKELHNQAHV